MQGAITTAFGKLQRDDTGAVSAWHPLVDHMTDVAACFKALCTCHSVRRALEHAAGRALGSQDIDRLAVLVFLHDLGKANSGFQSKRWHAAERPPEWPMPAGHSPETYVLFSAAFAHLVDCLPIGDIAEWGDAFEPLMIASISHHGRPIVQAPANHAPGIWRPVSGSAGSQPYDPAPVLREIGRTARELYPEAFAAGGLTLPDAPAFVHVFAGLVQLADWLGSDTDFFPYSDFGECRAETAARRAAAAVGTLGLDAEAWRVPLAVSPPTFEATFGNAPYPIQAEMQDERLGRLVILESETGSGKTEAALWRFFHLFSTGQVDSLYFALPTRVSASQAYGRVQRAVKRLWPTAGPTVVRALPGYAAADGVEPKSLPNFAVLWPDNPNDTVAQERWAAESPKRFLAAPIAVGTVDQALLGALRVRHAHLRHALLARSLLVVDEVHASDAYMTALLEKLLAAHLRCGGHALLLSATLGSSARDRYVALSPDGSAKPVSGTTFEAARDVPYPAISDHSGTHGVISVASSKLVRWSAHDVIDDPRAIAQMALDAAADGAKVLVIRNTVRDAVAVLKVLESEVADPAWILTVNGAVTLHHGRFSKQDRPLIDAAVEARLGKSRPPGPCIVVGTQTLEQSLDLDADLLISDLCPVDVLLQRIGRLHRHARAAKDRPESCRNARTLVLTPSGHRLDPMLKRARHGLGAFENGGGIYDDLRVVEATRRLLDEYPIITIPADNRLLVEAATHPERLQQIEALGKDWKDAGSNVLGQTGAQAAAGKLHALDTGIPFDSESNLFPDDRDIGTRLGARDWTVRLDPPVPGPFGIPVKELSIPHFQLPKEVAPDAEPEEVSHGDGILQFRLGNTWYRYSRLGLERVREE